MASAVSTSTEPATSTSHQRALLFIGSLIVVLILLHGGAGR